MNDAIPKPSGFHLPAAWREYVSYLRRPIHGQPSGLRAPGAKQMVGAMWLLDVLGLIVLLLVLNAYMAATGLPGPDAFDKFPKKWLLPAVVLAAPVVEEVLFRGWLSGRPRALWLLGCALALAGATTLLPLEPVAKGAVALAILLAMPLGWFLLMKRQAPGWFIRAFPALFWGTALVFGLVHLSNYPQLTPLALPLILPQIWAGLIFGFLRMRLGLVAGMMTHGAANLMAILPSVLGG